MHNCCSGFILPPTLDTREGSWWELDLLRFGFFRLLAALTDRRSTSLALKKATMNGCFDWGPCLPTRPAAFTLILRPRTEYASTWFMKNRESFPGVNEFRGYSKKRKALEHYRNVFFAGQWFLHTLTVYYYRQLSILGFSFCIILLPQSTLRLLR